MADNLPYMSSYGRISFILQKIKEAQTPERFTNDFLKVKIGAKSSNDFPFIGLAKRLNLLDSAGSPTELYKAFRSTDSKVSKAAMAACLKIAYSNLYSVNEYAHDLTTKDLEGLVIQITGLDAKNRVVTLIVKTYETLKQFANFDKSLDDFKEKIKDDKITIDGKSDKNASEYSELEMNLNYTINLVLPKTDDISVFNAIFKSLKENLLRK